MISDALKPYAYAVVAAALFGAGFAVNGWRLGATVADLKAQHSKTVADAATAAGKQLAKVTAERDALAGQLSTIDTEMTALQKGKKDAEEKLRLAVRSGAVGLRVAATCPAVNAAPTGTAQGIGLDSGTAPVLNPAAEQDYFALRQNIIDGESKLTACQRSLGAFSGQVGPTP